MFLPPLIFLLYCDLRLLRVSARAVSSAQSSLSVCYPGPRRSDSSCPACRCCLRLTAPSLLLALRFNNGSGSSPLLPSPSPSPFLFPTPPHPYLPSLPLHPALSPSLPSFFPPSLYAPYIFVNNSLQITRLQGSTISCQHPICCDIQFFFVSCQMCVYIYVFRENGITS